jgi:hypothetical protein
MLIEKDSSARMVTQSILIGAMLMNMENLVLTTALNQRRMYCTIIRRMVRCTHGMESL